MEQEESKSSFYNDLLSPSVKQIGEELGLFTHKALLRCKWKKARMNAEKNIKETLHSTAEKVNRIPETKRCEPEPYVVIPIIQQITYCYDSQELREMYANLLASSMNTDKKWKVHPSYIDIIKQLSPDEAKVLFELKKHLITYFPLLDLVGESKMSGGLRTIARNLINTNLYEVCENPNNMSFYIDNLVRLQIICISETKRVDSENWYKALEQSSFAQKLCKEVTPDEKIKFERKSFYMSDYGKAFIDCCI